jgi:hypothetical protein
MLEHKALDILRAYDKGKACLDETLETVLSYDKLFGEKRNHRNWYLRVLEDQPWKACDCPICREIGIEVIIFRGNNRNRRRGFHNVKVFYEQFCRAVKQSAESGTMDHEKLHDRNGCSQLSFDF